MRYLPRRVRLGGVDIKIEKVAHLNDEAANEDGMFNALYGHFEPDFLVIRLTAAGPERLKNTLVHEVLHAMLGACDLDVDLTAGNVTLTEEQFVGRLTPVLLGFLRDNPSVVAFLQATS